VDDQSLIGTPASSRVHPDDRHRTDRALAEALARPNQPIRVEYRYQHQEHGWRHLSSVASNLLEDPAVRGIVVNSRDVSDQRALETQLLQAQKMEAVGQLAGGIAHDFNNLLSVMTSYTGILLSELPADSPMRDDMEEVRRAAERAAALTRQLLAFSRRQVLQPQVLDLNEVVRDLERMLLRVLPEDVRLASLLSPKLGRVHADPGQLEQVIVNLAVNARDAMPGGGVLTLETSNVELDAEYCRSHAEVSPGAYVLLTVSDTGVGMDAVTQARAFDPFFTTKDVGKGTGLGLSTVYGIVKQSGGHVAIYSEPGVGTTLKVYLPRVDAAATRRTPSGSHNLVMPGRETVLLVEDDAQVRLAARRVLESAGYRILEASSATEALRVAEASDVRIDLLLTDMVMPEMSGRELAVLFRERYPTVVTVFMSGYSEEAVMRQGMLEPQTVFISKPFTPQTLSQRLREALDAGFSDRVS
jgi:two-component system, cell cycle sensor histidine kinase and response regulator CckA